MLESLNEFFANNSTLIMIAVGALLAIVAFVMFKQRSSSQSMPQQTPVNTPAHDLEGMDNVNMVCDLANGVCNPQQVEMQEQQSQPAENNNSQ